MDSLPMKQYEYAHWLGCMFPKLFLLCLEVYFRGDTVFAILVMVLIRFSSGESVLQDGFQI